METDTRAAGPGDAFEVESAWALVEKPVAPPEWAIDGWLAADTKRLLIAGRPKSRKSTLATELAVSLTTGTPFLGEVSARVDPEPVLLVSEEGDRRSFRARLAAIAKDRGLGHVLDPEHVKKAVKSIFDYNWRNPIGGFSNVQRVYALNDDAGLLLCSWPKGNRPMLPFVYSDEVWTGIEYQVAATLIYNGWIDEGLSIVKGVRDRYDGLRRNPWNEVECGHHYARAMASWAVLLALSGYDYDGVENELTFAPAIDPDDFQCFWSTGSAWGTFEQTKAGAKLNDLSQRAK